MRLFSFITGSLTADPSPVSIDNPLLYRDTDDLKRDVRKFYQRYELEDVVDEQLLLRGARFAQDDVLFKESEVLGRVERRRSKGKRTQN